MAQVVIVINILYSFNRSTRNSSGVAVVVVVVVAVE